MRCPLRPSGRVFQRDIISRADYNDQCNQHEKRSKIFEKSKISIIVNGKFDPATTAALYSRVIAIGDIPRHSTSFSSVTRLLINVHCEIDASRNYQGFEGNLRRPLNLGITAGGGNAPQPFVNDRNTGSPIGRALCRQ